MVSLRLIAPLLVLLAVLPASVYFGGPALYLALAGGCVVLIATTLYLAFGPSDGGPAHATNA